MKRYVVVNPDNYGQVWVANNTIVFSSPNLKEYLGKSFSGLLAQCKRFCWYVEERAIISHKD